MMGGGDWEVEASGERELALRVVHQRGSWEERSADPGRGSKLRRTAARRCGAIAALSAIGLSFTACGADDGRLHLVVTSDLSVPRDIDTLKWEIFLRTDSSPYATELVPLANPRELPSALDVVRGPGTKGTVRVRVAGLLGGTNGTVRVSREVELRPPKSGQRTVWLPLNWLCSDSNLGEEGCGEGNACQAGWCVPAADMPATELPESADHRIECLDVSNCFGRQTTSSRPRDNDGRCELPDSQAQGGVNVNVALELNTWTSGMAGTCEPGGSCLVVLDRHPVEGWSTIYENGVARGIELPRAVCEVNVQRVLVAPANRDCPVKEPGLPICEAERTCVEAAGPCDSQWQDWQGYSCFGASEPEVVGEDETLFCAPVSADSDAAASAGSTQHLCCTAGRTSSDDELLIDDMSNGPQVNVAGSEREQGGFWYTYTNDFTRPVHPPPDTLFTYRTVDPKDGDGNSLPFDQAACLSSEGYSGYNSEMGFGLLASGMPFDVGRYRGIEFWAWSERTSPLLELGAGIRVEFANVDTSEHDDGTCAQDYEPGDAPDCDDHFGETVQLYPYWEHYAIEWGELAQSRIEWGQQFECFDPNIYSVSFSYRGVGDEGTSQPFDFCVSQIRFLQNDSSEDAELLCN